MNLFDILGPVMVGPSSSHTAGAVRLGRIARRLLGEGTPCRADITLFGSFAATGCGHGTDRALIAGLLGFQPDDERIAGSFGWAEKAGLSFSFATSHIGGEHPNTARVDLVGRSGKTLSMTGSSLGGGRIMVVDFKLTLFANQFFLIYLYFQSTFVSRPYYTFTPIRMSFVSSGVSIGVKWRM